VGIGDEQTVPGAKGVGFLNQYIGQCIALRASSSATINDTAGSFWASGRTLPGPINSMLATPNSKNPDCGAYPGTNSMFAMRSRHPGGVNTLLADGSVRFIKDSVNQLTWWSLGTKAGGEVISADAY
jgi:prepilin-type processing-associated H-X9-DG protein